MGRRRVARLRPLRRCGVHGTHRIDEAEHVVEEPEELDKKHALLPMGWQVPVVDESREAKEEHAQTGDRDEHDEHNIRRVDLASVVINPRIDASNDVGVACADAKKDRQHV